MDREQYIIGVLGGMGTYATIHLFRQYAGVFSAEKEWDRPRIIIDNRCNMPSRVRAALYGEKREELVAGMSDSFSNLIRSGCSRIIVGCNTAHLFLPDVLSRLPEAEGKTLNIIETCADELCKNEVTHAFLLASEGTIESGIYQKALKKRGICCRAPGKEEYTLLRDCIEAVKNNCCTDDIRSTFSELMHRDKVCILGCTELPVLYEKYREICSDVEVYDPVYLTLSQLSKEYYREYK